MESPDGMEVRNSIREMNHAKAEVNWSGDTLPFVGCYFDGATPIYRYVSEGKEVHYNPHNEVFRAIRHTDGSQHTLTPVSVENRTITLAER